MVNWTNGTLSWLSILCGDRIALLSLRRDTLLRDTDTTFIWLAIDAIGNRHTENKGSHTARFLLTARSSASIGVGVGPRVSESDLQIAVDRRPPIPQVRLHAAA